MQSASPRSLDTRDRTLAIGIVGAGPSGLTVAEELRALGYADVTVLEASQEPGGKVCSLPATAAHGGIELGTVWYIPGPVYDRYLRRYGIVTAGRRTPPLRVWDRASQRAVHPLARPAGVSRRAWAGALGRLLQALRPFTAGARPGFAGAPLRDRAMPSERWFEQHGLQALRTNLLTLPVALQFGPTERDLAVGYVLAGLSLLRRYGFWEMARLRYRQIPTGNQELWRRMGQAHAVRLGQRVTEIRRGERIEVATTTDRHTFDRLVWTADMGEFLRVADASADEKRIFSRVRTMRRLVLVHRVEALREPSLIVVRDGANVHLPPGEPQILLSLPGADGLCAFYAFPDATTSIADVERHCADLVAQLGGRLGARVVPATTWSWFPHFAVEDIAAGVYDRVAAMQGQRGTYFAGELLAGVGVAFATEFGADLVARHFAAG